MGEEHSAQKAAAGTVKEIWEWLRAILIAVLLFFLIRSFVFAPFIVDGDSMVPSLHDGERLIVTRIFYYFTEPQRGDVVVFHASAERDYIKRVIGLPGDTVEMRQDRLWINGEEVDEPYIAQMRQWAREHGIYYTEDFGPVTVPQGHYFVLGDNRRNSRDSRSIGAIPKEGIVGRADWVFWPLQEMRKVD